MFGQNSLIEGDKALTEEPQPVAFPTVALTLVSIVIALGIEHLLGHISVLVSDATGTNRLLIALQGATTFVTVGAVWIAYATQLMTAAWVARLQDFFAPLLILSLLYFWISAIGTSGPAWFYLATIGWAVAAYGQRFGQPHEVAARMHPDSPENRRNFSSLVGLCLLGASGGIANQLGAMNSTGAVALVSLLFAVQLLHVWFLYRTWRASLSDG